MVRTFASVLTAALLVFGGIGLSSGAPAADGGADAGASCVNYWGEPRPTGYGYRHVVVLKSSCKKPSTCDVSTDVNPEVQKVTVGAGETREVVTFLESPSSAFTPRVSCK